MISFLIFLAGLLAGVIAGTAIASWVFSEVINQTAAQCTSLMDVAMRQRETLREAEALIDLYRADAAAERDEADWWKGDGQ